jgi:hypothetical protein
MHALGTSSLFRLNFPLRENKANNATSQRHGLASVDRPLPPLPSTVRSSGPTPEILISPRKIEFHPNFAHFG